MAKKQSIQVRVTEHLQRIFDRGTFNIEDFADQLKTDLLDNSERSNMCYNFEWNAIDAMNAAVKRDIASYHLGYVDPKYVGEMTDDDMRKWYEDKKEYVLSQAKRISNSSSVMANLIAQYKLAEEAEVINTIKLFFSK